MELTGCPVLQGKKLNSKNLRCKLGVKDKKQFSVDPVSSLQYKVYNGNKQEIEQIFYSLFKEILSSKAPIRK